MEMFDVNEVPSGVSWKPFETRPIGPLGIIAMAGCEAIGQRVDQYLRDWREGRASRARICIPSLATT